MNSESQNPERPHGEQPNTDPQSTVPQNQTGGHDVPLTPPQAEPTYIPPAVSPTPPVSQASGGGGARAAAIAIAAFGGLALLGAGGTAAFAAVHDISRSGSAARGETQSVSVEGIDSLDVDVAASSVNVRFGDVEEATLEVVRAGEGNWTLKRDGDELHLSNDRNPFGWFNGDWFGRDWFNDDENVVLTLPESVNDAGLDADFSLNAGSLDIEGLFGDVDIEMGAGDLRMEGSAESISVDVSAGRADLHLFAVTEADFTIAAGDLVAEIADTAPRLITVDVSAGSLELTVPDGVYNVTQDVSAGSLDNRLDTSSSSRHNIDATVSAGTVVLRAAD